MTMLTMTKSDLATTMSMLTMTKNDLITTNNNLGITNSNLMTTNSNVQTLTTSLSTLSTTVNARTKSLNDIGKIPTSCQDIYDAGFKINGIYLINGGTAVKAVYCNFFNLPSSYQKVIGNVDVKSKPVYFFATRSTHLSVTGRIPYDRIKVNIGDGLGANGVFSAPKAGIYVFSFIGLVEFLVPYVAGSTRPVLFVKMYGSSGGSTNIIGWGYADETHSNSGQSVETFSMQVTLNMKVGDEVWVNIEGITNAATIRLFNNEAITEQGTYFNGYLLEEDITQAIA